jgi:hypothetical protein
LRRALKIAIVCGLVACEKREPRKPRVDVTIWLDPPATVPADAVPVTTAAPPKTRQMFERSGIHVAVIGVPPESDPGLFLGGAVYDALRAGSNATIVVSTGCLKDLQAVLEKSLLPFWSVALMVGARCDGEVNPRIGAAALVEVGSASRVRITFDRNTGQFLKVEPIR